MHRLLPSLLLATACGRNPSEQLSWQETWEIVAITDDAYFLDAAMTVTNSGLLRGQGHVVVNLLRAGDSPIPLHSSIAPSAVDLHPRGDYLRMGSNTLDVERSGWTMSVREGESALDATIHLSADTLPRIPGSQAIPSVPPTTLVDGARQWVVGSPVPLATLNGAWRSGDRGGIFQGAGMAIHRAGDIWPLDRHKRFSFYACDQSWSIGIEQIGEHAVTWLATADGVQTGHTLSIKTSPSRVALNLEPDIQARIRFPIVQSTWRFPQWSHLLPFEGWVAARIWDPPVQQVQTVTAWVVVQGRVEHQIAALVRSASQPLLDTITPKAPTPHKKKSQPR